MTVHAELVEYYKDIENYITYVFQVLDEDNIQEIGKYLMCVQYPNWNQETITIGDIGFLKVKYVQAGIDQWFDGVSKHFYRYDDIIFLKFIKEKHKTDNITL